MRNFLFIAFLLAGISIANGQQFRFETGKTISSFRYLDAQEIELENLETTNHTFMNLGYRHNILTPGLFLDIDATYTGYGAVGSDRNLDNFYAWNLTYLGLRAGLDYELYKTGNFTFFINGAVSGEFLIQGTQTLNSQVYKLRGEEDFNTPLYVFRAGPGVSYNVTGNLSVFTRYNYGRSGTFRNIDGKLNINAHDLGFGFLVNISKTPPATGVESARISELQKELELNNQKVKELESVVEQVEELEEEISAREEEIQVKEKEIISLKDDISSALNPYKGRGLTVEERQGKVYITMENDMLFSSGSWELGPEGIEAVNALGEVLSANPDVTILIEGHTDNDPFRGNGIINDNWDLSAKRATAIVAILSDNKDIDPKNLTAAGRGEFDPIADNSTAEGKGKNRRIEVIVTPRLDEIMELIKE